MTLLLVLLGCSGATIDDSSSGESECGDPDGFGTDTGDIPNLLGSWTSTFAQNFYDDDCSTENLDSGTETWIGAMTIDGRAPDALYMEFGTLADERYWGATDQNGGITLSGVHAHSEGALHAQFGGLVYHDKYLDRDVIDGAVFLGLDSDEDGTIDCRAKGSWKAIKSGL
jgi:hypothetical protein